MSGHSKWANIKHKKEANDKVRGNVFGKLAKQITLAVIEGGGLTQPENNIRLRIAIDKARSANLPKENIQRAIEKGTGPNRQELKEIIYEAFSHAGAALIIVVTTDNSNRSAGEIRNILERHGGKIASQGAVSYLFKRCGSVKLAKKDNAEDAVFGFGERISAIDMSDDADSYTVYFPYENLVKANELMAGLTPVAQPDLEFKPMTSITLEEGRVKEVNSLIEALESLDDVHRVYSNLAN